MITFILNSKTIQTSQNAGVTLLDFIRYEKRLTGTKIGCREGDCGACSVLVGILQKNGQVKYQSITSCLSPLGNAQGKHIVTVEGVNLTGRLTPTQMAMKDNYATQCGFCTPGFVMGLTSYVLSRSEKSYENALNAISGNICRCTGYKSIEKAADELSQKMSNQESNSLNWLIQNEFIPSYFKEIPERLAKLITKRKAEKRAVYVSGGTDLYVQRADQLIGNDVTLIAQNENLKGISIKDNICIVGAGNVVSDLWNHRELNDFIPELKKHLKLVSSEQIRNMASFGGNLVNASPIGDMTIFFQALNSDLTIVNEMGKERILPLKNFYQGYKTYDLEDGELIKSISFKLPGGNSKFNFEKVSKRTHLDIASVNSAAKINSTESEIREAHISIGGVAAIPKYLNNTSVFLSGKSLSTSLIIEANEILQKEISPISDVRGSADYKRLLARQLFYSHFTKLFPNQISLTQLVSYE